MIISFKIPSRSLDALRSKINSFFLTEVAIILNYDSKCYDVRVRCT